jgi:hypothetical protein
MPATVNPFATGGEFRIISSSMPPTPHACLDEGIFVSILLVRQLLNVEELLLGPA